MAKIKKGSQRIVANVAALEMKGALGSEPHRWEEESGICLGGRDAGGIFHTCKAYLKVDAYEVYYYHCGCTSGWVGDYLVAIQRAMTQLRSQGIIE